MAGFCDSGIGLQTPKFGKCEAIRVKSPAPTANIPIFGRLRRETWFDRDYRLTVPEVQIPPAPPFD